MEYVVSEGGGGNAKIAGFRIGGKTGTADKVENGKYGSDTYSSFIGMAPMEDPQMVVLVVVDSPTGVQFGSATAAPIAKRVLGERFAISQRNAKVYGRRSKKKSNLNMHTCQMSRVKVSATPSAFWEATDLNMK